MRELPDFRNLGVVLRILLLVNVLALATVLMLEEEPRRYLDRFVGMAGRVELPLFFVVLVLYVLNPWLRRLRFARGASVVAVLVALVVFVVGPVLGIETEAARMRAVLWALVATCLSLIYFDYRSQRYSPALTEARLLALTARIRPHFLFNSLNGVLGVIREDPRRAERALEELAELFRALMQDNRELVPLADEIGLCERYIDLEQLRLGERLQVEWERSACPPDALVPPLLLQPLIENAVYHGVEPAAAPEPVRIVVRRVGGELRIVVENAVVDQGRHASGNRMALDNIRERLMLFFDLEARLDAGIRNERYRVSIRLPYRKTRGRRHVARG